MPSYFIQADVQAITLHAPERLVLHSGIQNETEDIENNRFFSDVYRSNISITNIVPQRQKSALTLVCLVAPISWRKKTVSTYIKMSGH